MQDCHMGHYSEYDEYPDTEKTVYAGEHRGIYIDGEEDSNLIYSNVWSDKRNENVQICNLEDDLETHQQDIDLILVDNYQRCLDLIFDTFKASKDYNNPDQNYANLRTALEKKISSLFI